MVIIELYLPELEVKSVWPFPRLLLVRSKFSGACVADCRGERLLLNGVEAVGSEEHCTLTSSTAEIVQNKKYDIFLVVLVLMVGRI